MIWRISDQWSYKMDVNCSANSSYRARGFCSTRGLLVKLKVTLACTDYTIFPGKMPAKMNLLSVQTATEAPDESAEQRESVLHTASSQRQIVFLLLLISSYLVTYLPRRTIKARSVVASWRLVMHRKRRRVCLIELQRTVFLSHLAIPSPAMPCANPLI